MGTFWNSGNKKINYIRPKLVIRKKLVVKNEQGLHARPAALFVQIANKFDSNIIVRKGRSAANGKSIMGILMLEVGRGTKIWIEAEGEDARKAIESLEKIVLDEYGPI